MEEQIINIETAKLAWQKGYNKEGIYCKTGYYTLDGRHSGEFNVALDEEGKDYKGLQFVASPTQSLLQKWLREEHGIHICIMPSMCGEQEAWTIDLIKSFRPLAPVISVDGYGYCDSYEDALEVGLKEALHLIK